MKIIEKNYPQETQGLGKSKATQQNNKTNAAALKPQGTEASELGSSKVKLSERAQDMKKIREQIAATPDVDEAKVAKYKSMLSKGEYKVDSKAVADRMVDEHLKNDFLNIAGNDDS